MSKQEILHEVLKLQSQGRISLRKALTSTPKRITKYLRTPGAYWYWITIVFATIMAIVVFTVPENAYPLVCVRYVLGAIFVLWLPGHSFIRALFPQEILTKSTKDLDLIVRIALSLGMSLALVPIVGLILNYTPWGIRLTPIVLSLLSLTTIFATAAIIREHRNKLQKQM